ncbi:MAG TPA: S8 family serine peptidase, partial [Pyrinomonadaceae bacterium]|nr:S8 family serine peptidase [Pyrinomonadaceae bacterium]
MKFPRSTSRSVSICVSLLIAYAQIISSLVVSLPRTAYASFARQVATNEKASKPLAQGSSGVTFVQDHQKPMYREDEVLVRFRATATEHEKNTVALVHGAGRKKLKGESGVEKFKVSGQSAQTVALSLLQQPSVELAEPNFLIRSDQAEGTLPNDAQFSEQWALRNTGQNGSQFGSDINATAGWQFHTGTQSTVVAVIDSGIDFGHPDLAGNQWINSSPGPEGDVHGWDYIADDGVIKDDQGHGTAIAGIIAAQGNNGAGISGVMWQAGIMSLRVLDNTGTGDIADAVEAIDYAVTHGAHVINISWGTNGESLVLKDALERALRRGVVVVCSAGNGGQNVDTASYYPASFGLRDLITVAATDNKDQLVSWSNWGSANVTVAAPGTNILTTKMGGGYWSVTGTSASAPLVAGLAGLIKTAQPGLRPNQVAQTITKGARDVASLQGKVLAGGVANVANSLTGLQGGHNRPASLPTPGFGSGGTGPGGTFSTAPPPRTTQAPANNLPNLNERRTARAEQPQARQPIQSNLMCADCDPQSGGGGGSYYPKSDPNFSTARMRPANEVGTPGVDLGSRNFNWGIPLVSLPGRAGMDLNLALSYNSLVWTKDGSYIKYNADLGSPAPGFRLGLPILQQSFLDSQTSANAYLMVTSSGARVKMRQVGTSAIYESMDGRYTQLDATNPDAPVVRSTDGTQMTFERAPINGEFRCNEIKDRNGNFISATFNPTNGHLSTITDTLGRVITFVYDASSNLQAIRQTWAGVAHDWATFEYGQVYVEPSFGGGLLVNGPNNNYVTVLNRVNLHDGAYFTFAYNVAFGQVNRINHYAADGHLLEYTSYNVHSSAGQTDCPRFTERRDWAENWNNGAEAITYYAAAGDNSWSNVTTPDGVIYKEFYATTTWQTGLTTTTKIYQNAAAESADIPNKRATVSWTQDDTSLLYQKNPRVIETNVYDDANNRKRVTIDYGPYAQWSLPYLVKEYAADGTTEIRHSFTDYNLSQAYLDRRIIGLVSARHLSDTI